MPCVCPSVGHSRHKPPPLSSLHPQHHGALKGLRWVVTATVLQCTGEDRGAGAGQVTHRSLRTGGAGPGPIQPAPAGPCWPGAEHPGSPLRLGPSGPPGGLPGRGGPCRQPRLGEPLRTTRSPRRAQGPETELGQQPHPTPGPDPSPPGQVNTSHVALGPAPDLKGCWHLSAPVRPRALLGLSAAPACRRFGPDSPHGLVSTREVPGGVQGTLRTAALTIQSGGGGHRWACGVCRTVGSVSLRTPLRETG